MEILEAEVVSFRRGLRTQRPKECLIRFQDIESVREAGQLIGRKIAWSKKEPKIFGKIVSLHANNEKTSKWSAECQKMDSIFF